MSGRKQTPGSERIRHDSIASICPVLTRAQNRLQRIRFFVAAYNSREEAHRRCVETCEKVDGPIVTCEACLTEALRLLGHASAAAGGILARIAQGALQAPFHLASHRAEIAGLMRKHRDAPVDFADAGQIHLADQRGTGDILTLDSHFKHDRWRRNLSFRLLIPQD